MNLFLLKQAANRAGLSGREVQHHEAYSGLWMLKRHCWWRVIDIFIWRNCLPAQKKNHEITFGKRMFLLKVSSKALNECHTQTHVTLKWQTNGTYEEVSFDIWEVISNGKVQNTGILKDSEMHWLIYVHAVYQSLCFRLCIS